VDQRDFLRGRTAGSGPALVAAGLLLAAVGCGTLESYESRLDGLVGTPIAELRAGMGTQPEVDVKGETEFLTYEWVIRGIPERAARSRIPGNAPGGAFDEVRVDGICTFTFEVRDRLVQSVVKAEGRTTIGTYYTRECRRELVELFPDRRAER